LHACKGDSAVFSETEPDTEPEEIPEDGVPLTQPDREDGKRGVTIEDDGTPTAVPRTGAGADNFVLVLVLVLAGALVL